MHLHEEHHSGDGEADTHKHDAESTERPAIVQVVVEELRDARAAESAGDHGGVVDAEDDHAVPQSGHVGDHHVNDIL